LERLSFDQTKRSNGLKWPSHDASGQIFYIFKPFYTHDFTGLCATIATSAVDQVSFVFGKIFDLRHEGG
jgi:hypothetical protein